MMSMLKSGLRKDQKGQAAVEALLVLMIMALVIFGGLELSRGVAIRQALDSSTGAAVRALSLDPAQWSYSRDLVRDGTNQNVMGESVTTTLQVFDAAGTLTQFSLAFRKSFWYDFHLGSICSVPGGYSISI